MVNFTARFDGSWDVKAWLRTLELIFDAKWLSPEERFLHTLPLLAKSVLKTYEYSHTHIIPTAVRYADAAYL